MSNLPVPRTEGAPPPPPIISAATALRRFKPIEAVIEGLPAPRGGLIAITGTTGAGKTTLAAEMQLALCRGEPFAGRQVTQGDVLVLAGESPDDYLMHLAATMQARGLTVDDLEKRPGQLLVIPGTFAIDYELDYIEGHLQNLHNVRLCAVFVDTSAAFFGGDDENDNVSMRQHASMLRELATLPGNPCVIVLCHPTKTAQHDNLLPRGGGAFLAEIDANLTLSKSSADIVSLHWAGKIRGPAFDPVQFEFVPVELAGHRDCRGKPIWSVAARHVPAERVEQLHLKDSNDDDVLIGVMQRNQGASLRMLAMKCGWTSDTMRPLSARVERRLKALEKHGLVEQDRKSKWMLTTKGQKEAGKLP